MIPKYKTLCTIINELAEIGSCDLKTLSSSDIIEMAMMLSELQKILSEELLSRGEK